MQENDDDLQDEDIIDVASELMAHPVTANVVEFPKKLRNGRATRRELAQSQPKVFRAHDDDVEALTEDEANDALEHELSPAHVNLSLVRNLKQLISEGGKSGSDSARLLREIMKECIVVPKRAVHVKLQVC